MNKKCKRMNIQKWWKIYPLKYKAMSALISIMLLGSLLLLAFSLLHLATSLVVLAGGAEISVYLYTIIAFVAVVGFPFVSFVYLDMLRKQVRDDDNEIDVRLKDALAKSMNGH